MPPQPLSYPKSLSAFGRRLLSRPPIQSRDQRVGPFDHEIEWVDGTISGGRTPTMIWGTTTVEAASKKYGWHPGVFKNENFDMRVLTQQFGGSMLNDDAKFYKL